MSVKTADRTLDLIELFARRKAALSLSDIAALLEIPASSAHALIKTLEARGYLYEAAPRRGYYPTRRLKDMTDAIGEGVSVLKKIAPVLVALRDATQETVIVARRQDVYGVYIDAYESQQSVRFSPTIGEKKPLHSTATGKALLGALPPARLQQVLARLPMGAVTCNTITDRERLRQDLLQGQSRGWHSVLGENILELMSVARTVCLQGETLAIGLAGSVQRFEPLMQEHAARLVQACQEIELRLKQD